MKLRAKRVALTLIQPYIYRGSGEGLGHHHLHHIHQSTMKRTRDTTTAASAKEETKSPAAKKTKQSPGERPAVHLACHCGAMKMTCPLPSNYINECRCTVCYRWGASWAYYKPSEVTFEAAESDKKIYTCGKKKLRFVFCGTCSGLCCWEVNKDKPGTRMGVNMRLAVDRKVLDGVERVQHNN